MFIAFVVNSNSFSTLPMMLSPSPIFMMNVRPPCNKVNMSFFRCWRWILMKVNVWLQWCRYWVGWVGWHLKAWSSLATFPSTGTLLLFKLSALYRSSKQMVTLTLARLPFLGKPSYTLQFEWNESVVQVWRLVFWWDKVIIGLSGRLS